jgi:hypothetical protein
MRKIAILLATALLAAGPAAPCAADSFCSCGGKQSSVRESFGRSGAVFRGVVVEMQSWAPGSAPPAAFRSVRLRVTERWKGAAGDTVTVLTSWGPGMCGYQFTQGAEHVVYASDLSPEVPLFVDLCGRTRMSKDADREIRALRRISGNRARAQAPPPAEGAPPRTRGER